MDKKMLRLIAAGVIAYAYSLVAAREARGGAKNAEEDAKADVAVKAAIVATAITVLS